MRHMVYIVVALLFAAAPPPASAQEGRYELGRRLFAFETTLAEHNSQAALERATPYLNEAVHEFFTSRWPEAAAALDMARMRLISAEPPSMAVRWAAALSLTPHTFMLEAQTDELGFVITPFYKVATDPPKTAVEVDVRTVAGEPAGRVTLTLAALPQRDVLPLRVRAEGDYLLSADAIVEGSRQTIAHHQISLVSQMLPRLHKLREGLRALPPVQRNSQRATLEDYIAMLSALARGGQMETKIPGSKLMREAENLLEAETAGRSYFGHGRPGQFWLTLAAPTGTVRVRLLAPDAVKEGKPLPLVIALHGAGGSENMFFDAYGAGKIVDLCNERNWLLVAPSATFFGLGLSAQKMVDAISEMYPVDASRVMIVGHSMGAGHGIRIAELLTTPPLALAALGGGGRIRQGERLRNTAFFLGVGSEDFLLDNVRSLDGALREAGVAKVELKEYPQVEHLAIVQLALDEVFAHFDRQVGAAR